MDSLRLLSRSARPTNHGTKSAKQSTPSNGQHAQPQLFPAVSPSRDGQAAASKKRKRSHKAPTTADAHTPEPGLFGVRANLESLAIAHAPAVEDVAGSKTDGKRMPDDLSSDEVRALLKQHKLKITWLNAGALQKKRKGKGESKAKMEKPQLYPQPLRSFHELADRHALASRIAINIRDHGYNTPTEVQMVALPLLMGRPDSYLPAATDADAQQTLIAGGADLLSVAPTGSGKTLAFMIPLISKIVQEKSEDEKTAPVTSAIVLAPTKELTSQIVNEGRKLANGTRIRITQLRKGMRLPFAETDLASGDTEQPAVKADIIVSTPGLLYSMLDDEENAKKTSLHGVRYLVLDEADVLLDPLFRDQTLRVWNRLSDPGLRVSLWSATMGSNIEELARSAIQARRQRLSAQHGDVPEAPLIRLVVGLKDSVVPNIEHRLVYAATEQGKLMGLRQLLHPAAASKDVGAPLLPPFLVFTQTIERAVALHSELLYDIPAEAGGIGRIAVLHSDLTDIARDNVMTRFRKGEIWILITTDLLSRGVDFRGVNGVVNYDIPTSSAAYVHRVGRTGRAGREGGVAVTLYSKEDIPYLKHVANVVAMAQKHNGTSDGGGMQQWLLDALPTLSKPDKLKLKKRGIESRTSRGKEADPKSARRARISSKSGFDRKLENNRQGAILGSKRRKQAEDASEAEGDSEFEGFD
ncbi:hypothetical protein LTR08_000555 [Meristemomyces frigidus]|nr:hypothetical protein LTR08_000555 [Meristemomyces frigidus]